MKATATLVTIRKDMFFPSRKWTADLHFDSGRAWMAWQSGFKTRTAMVENIRASWDGEIRNEY